MRECGVVFPHRLQGLLPARIDLDAIAPTEAHCHGAGQPSRRTFQGLHAPSCNAFQTNLEVWPGATAAKRWHQAGGRRVDGNPDWITSAARVARLLLNLFDQWLALAVADEVKVFDVQA